MTRSDVYGSVTDRIIEAIKNDTAPWRMPWVGGRPSNITNGRHYRGINTFLLTLMASAKGYNDHRWGTFAAIHKTAITEARRQGREIVVEFERSKEVAYEIVDGQRIRYMGGVRKGEKATRVILWKPVPKRRTEHEENEEHGSYLLLREYPVFNACQASDMPALPTFEHDPIEQAEEIVQSYVPNGPLIQFGGGSAHYEPARDIVACPNLSQFKSVEGYYSTLYHELVHSTGHESRLNRLLRNGFGSSPYAKEELVAEMGAAMLCGMAGIDNLDQSAAYLKGWLKPLSEDPKFAVQAAAQAQKAADLILGVSFDSQETENQPVAVAA